MLAQGKSLGSLNTALVQGGVLGRQISAHIGTCYSIQKLDGVGHDDNRPSTE